MHINFRTYPTIKLTLAQVLHTRANSHAQQHLNTLRLLICGIVGAQHVQFDKLASHAPRCGRKNQSLITRFRRWVKHEDITLEALWLPVARSLLAALAKAPLTILLDGTTAGRGCVIVMASLVYHRRAIALLWTVVKAKKGHLPQDVHCTLIRRLQELIPSDATVSVLGDGEFDGTSCRPQCARHGLRFRIECLFANHKSRGFRIDKSDLADPARLARLVIASSLAYLWIDAAAVFAHAHGWVEQFRFFRTSRERPYI